VYPTPRVLTDVNTFYCIGLGRNWLQRAQATLARIHREEGNDSSSQGSSSQAGNLPQARQLVEDEYDANDEPASPPADPRRQGPLYVEARGYLQPAVDFYARAVRSADALGSTTGDILASVSRTPFMSLIKLTIHRLQNHKCLSVMLQALQEMNATSLKLFAISVEQRLRQDIFCQFTCSSKNNHFPLDSVSFLLGHLLSISYNPRISKRATISQFNRKAT
jgi:hypothetical protein